ncbi:MAG TPA: hypothetical protein VF525_12000 [Pyrinomonadaceae bacterium]
MVHCSACGARAVGPPLARPEQELPAYGRALAVGAVGGLLAVSFLVGTLVALIERHPFSLAFWNVVASAETAAWRLKLLALPLSLLALWPSLRVVLTLRREPVRFAGLRLARAGFALSALVALASALLIGVTVPERLRHRALAAQAAQNAVTYEISSALLKYQIRYHSYPTSAAELRAKLPDTDGSIAKAAALMETGTYDPQSDIASLPAAGAKARTRRVAALRVRNASLRASVDDTSEPDGLSFTSYKLVLPGPDKKLGTADDITLRDGVVVPTTTPPAARTTQGSGSSNMP